MTPVQEPAFHGWTQAQKSSPTKDGRNVESVAPSDAQNEDELI